MKLENTCIGTKVVVDSNGIGVPFWLKGYDNIYGTFSGCVNRGEHFGIIETIDGATIEVPLKYLREVEKEEFLEFLADVENRIKILRSEK